MKKIKIRVASFLIILSTLFSIIGIAPVYANETNLSDFPESYRPYIQALIKSHPKWVFEPYKTNVDWSELVEYQSQKDRNLIEKSSNPEYYFSKEPGNYNAETGTYIGKSGPDWVVPNDAVVEHYLDPRNFLNDSDVFMFLKLDYNAAVHTAEHVETLLKGSWMYNKKLEDDSTMTYAQAFVKTGKEAGVSSFFLAARVVQEQGSGTSPLITGTYSGYEGYYNYYNHGAYGNTTAEIIVNGLKSAKTNGWNTRYKSLYGGASTLATKYVARNQYTLYFQKFDVVDGISYHQYMQNIQAPMTEGWTMRKAYKNVGLLEEAYVFSVPVYDNMPEYACPLPTEADSKLPPSATVAAGNVDRGFGTMTVKVSDIVADKGVAKVEVKAFSTENGADDIYLYSGILNSDGSYTAKVDIKNHSNYRGEYTMEVYITDNTGYEEFVGSTTMTIGELQEPVMYVMQQDNTLKIVLRNVEGYMGVEKVYVPVWTENAGQDDIVWYTANYDGEVWKVTVQLSDHSEADRVYIAHVYITDGTGKQNFACGRSINIRDNDTIWGDVNFDGRINASDALIVLKGAAGIQELTIDEKDVADVNFDGKRNAIDALMILKHAAGVEPLPEFKW